MATASKKGQKAREKKQAPVKVTPHVSRGLRESALLISIAITLYLMASLFTFSMNDPAWNYSAPVTQYNNSGGVIGAWFSDVLFTVLLVGWDGYYL